jgi:hypothetical protein
MPKLDAIAIQLLDSHPAMQRWLRLSPRYAGRAAFSRRIVCCSRATAAQIVQSFRAAVEAGQIGVDIALDWNDDGEQRSCTLPSAGAI